MPIRVISRAPQTGARNVPPPFGLPLPPADWPQKPPGISLCMIVKNEERFLAQCLRSVAGIVDEINVVDTGSTDATVEIARSFGARIEHREWRGDFSWARNESLAMATKRWIFQLDADEELLPESRTAIEQLKNAPGHLMGVWVRCINASDRYRGGGTMSHAIVRLFPNTQRIRFQSPIHEFPSADGAPISIKAATAPIKIVHHGYLQEVVAERNKYERNMRIVEASIEEDPEEAFNWYNYGMTAHLGGDQDGGIKGLTRMWELCQAKGLRAFTANGLQTLADIYSEHKGQPEIGITYALECLKHAPRYANAHFSAGKAYFLMKRYEEAIAMYQQAIEDAPYIDVQFVADDEVPKWKAQCEIGSICAEMGQHERALEWFDKGLAARPAIQPLRLNRANALEQLGRLSEAEAAFRSVYDEFRDEQSTLTYVNYLLRHHQPQEAVRIIEREHAAFSKPAAASALLAAAAVAERAGWEGVERYVRLACEADPNCEEARAALARLERARLPEPVAIAELKAAVASGDFAGALETAGRALVADPSNAALLYYAALCAANLDRKSEAMGFLDRIGENDSGAAADMLRIALLREFGRNEEALRAADRVLAHDERNVDVRLLRAALLEALGRGAEAESVLREAMSLDRRRAGLELSALYLRMGRAPDAKRVAGEALAPTA